jgi:ubiquitin carboxyl-terminal hydrolase 4/11
MSKLPLNKTGMHPKSGLVNLGNSCYMNTAIQCISASPELLKYFTSDLYKKDLEFSKNHSMMEGRVAETFA